MSDQLAQAIALIRSGDAAAGAQLLTDLLRADPGNETAWLWLSSVVPTDEQRRDCLERVLVINPSSAPARRGLERLEAQPAPHSADCAARETTDMPAPPRVEPAPVSWAVAQPALPSDAADRRLIIITAIRSLVGPLMALGLVAFMSYASFFAAGEIAAGARAPIRGRYALVKLAYAGLLAVLGPRGVLVVGALLTLLALAWVVVRVKRAAAVIAAVLPMAAVPGAGGSIALAGVFGRPGSRERQRALRIALVGAIVLAASGVGWMIVTRPRSYPGLIEGGMVLDLSNRGLTSVALGDVPADQLLLVDLSQNPLTALPREIGDLSRIEALYVSGTNLERLPPEIGRLTNLRQLILAHNRLTALPPEIGQLVNLEVLDVQGNRLTTLPPELGRLTRLRQLNLQFNPLGHNAIPPEVRRLRAQIFVLPSQQ